LIRAKYLTKMYYLPLVDWTVRPADGLDYYLESKMLR